MKRTFAAALVATLLSPLALSPRAVAQNPRMHDAVKWPDVPDSVPTVKPVWVRTKHGQPYPPHPIPGTPATPPPPGLYVALGDSITQGTGITDTCGGYPDHPVDIDAFCAAPHGKSYSERVARELRAKGIAGMYMNAGIGGATVTTVIEDELPWLPANATIITLYLGTNDTRAPFTRKISPEETLAKFKKGYKIILDYIHKTAPQAKVYLVNVPNQKFLDGIGNMKDYLDVFEKTSTAVDTYIDSLYPQYPVVDLVCLPTTYDMSLQFAGSVHPNDEGAAPLAAAITQVIEAKKPSPPAASCTWFNHPGGTPPAPAPSYVRPKGGKAATAAPPE